MKIIQTSDWHLGHRYQGYSRLDEYDVFFQQLRDIIKERKPDLMIVAGDVFDEFIPDAETIELFQNAIRSIFKVSKKLIIAIVSGNHDYGVFLEKLCKGQKQQRLWACGMIHASGISYDFEKHVRTFSFAKAKGQVVLIPPVSDEFCPECIGSSPEMTSSQKFLAALGNHLESSSMKDIPRVLVYHGKIFKTGQKQKNDIELKELLALKPDYIAAGHLHHMRVNTDDRYAYAGSPYHVNQSDKTDRHILWINLESADAAPVIEAISLSPKRELRLFPAKAEPADSILKQLEEQHESLIHYYDLQILKPETEADCVKFKKKLRRLAELYSIRICSLLWFHDDNKVKEKFVPNLKSVGSENADNTLHRHVVRRALEELMKSQQTLIDHYSQEILAIPRLVNQLSSHKAVWESSSRSFEPLESEVNQCLSKIGQEMKSLMELFASESYQTEKRLLQQYHIEETGLDHLRTNPHFAIVYDQFTDRFRHLQAALQGLTEDINKRELLIATLKDKAAKGDAGKYVNLIQGNQKQLKKKQEQLDQIQKIGTRCKAIIGSAPVQKTPIAPVPDLLKQWIELEKEISLQEDTLKHLAEVAQNHAQNEKRMMELKCEKKVYKELLESLRKRSKQPAHQKELSDLLKIIEQLSNKKIQLGKYQSQIENDLNRMQQLFNQL